MIERQVDIESLKAADRAKKYGFPYCKGLFTDCPVPFILFNAIIFLGSFFMNISFEQFKKILTIVVLALVLLGFLVITAPSDSPIGKAIDFLRPEKTGNSFSGSQGSTGSAFPTENGYYNFGK